MAFDIPATDWDVCDQRGKSSRVFGPGTRKRDRREKKSYFSKLGAIDDTEKIIAE